MFEGTKQAKMLEKFARSYGLEYDVEFYDVATGKKRALYRGATPQRTKNRKLRRTLYRWQWKAPLGMKRTCDHVILHGVAFPRRKALETFFVVPISEFQGQVVSYPGQKKQISLDCSPDASPNKRTRFYFIFKKSRTQFKAWLQKRGLKPRVADPSTPPR
jgi:hypothetical protein